MTWENHRESTYVSDVSQSPVPGTNLAEFGLRAKGTDVLDCDTSGRRGVGVLKKRMTRRLWVGGGKLGGGDNCSHPSGTPEKLWKQRHLHLPCGSTSPHTSSPPSPPPPPPSSPSCSSPGSTLCPTLPRNPPLQHLVAV